MDNDTNGIARLAIRLFSIITNSGATECNFSDFGNIQTKKRSRLSVDKTHKINVVRMDICRRHQSLGLLKCRGKRKLGDDDEPSSIAVDEPSDAEDYSFEGLAQNLINSAINDEAADAADKAEEATAPSSAPAAVLNQQRTRRPAHTQIPLASLFDFTRCNGPNLFSKNLQTSTCSARRYFSLEYRYLEPSPNEHLSSLVLDLNSDSHMTS
jgi:hypothetical protein